MDRLLIVALLYASIVFGQKDIVVASNIIQWKEGVFLKPDDFRLAKKSDPWSVKNALTTYKIEILPKEVMVDERNNIVNYQKMNLATYFYMDKSWLGNKNDPKALEHEQLYFDIAELFARKIRKAFEELKTKNIKDFDAYQNVYNKFWKECREYQYKFDSETWNGSKVIEANDWLLKVDEELHKLQDYTYDKVKIRWREKLNNNTPAGS